MSNFRKWRRTHNVRATSCLAIVAALLLLLAVIPAGAATYYVNINTGDDLNPGTEAQPWKHIDNHQTGTGDTTLQPGDIIEVAAGTYSDSTNPWGQVLLLVASGTATLPITYHANGQVIIDGSAFATTSPNIGMHFGANYITVDGFEIRYCARGAYLGGDPTSGRQGITIKNCKFHDIMPVSPGNDDMMLSIACGIYDSWSSATNTFHHNVFDTIGVTGAVPTNEPRNNNFAFAVGGCGVTGDCAYNNTITNTWCGIMFWAMGSGRTAVAKNNIITNVWGTAISTDNSAAITESYNLLFGNVENYGGLTSAGIADFVSDPLLNADYSLQATSPAINAGIDLGLTPVNGGAPDLGAIESAYTSGPGFLAGTAKTGGWAYTYRPVEPVPNAIVGEAIDPPDMPTFYAVTAADGSYRLPLPAGSQSIKTRYPFAQAVSDSITITSGAVTSKDYTILPAPGYTYYVAPTGSDSSPDPKNPATPLRSIGRVEQLGDFECLPGDVIEIAPGSYDPVTLSSKPGNLVAPIIYKCVGGKAVINLSGSGDGIILAPGITGIVLDGFEIKNAQRGIQIGGNDHASGAHHITIANCSMHNMLPAVPSGGPGESWASGIYTSCGYDNYIYNNVMYNIGIPGLLTNNSDGNNNWAAGVMGPLSADNRIFNNTMYNCWGGVFLWGDMGTDYIQNNIIANTWGKGIYHDSTPVICSNNLYFSNAMDITGNASYGTGDMGGDPKFTSLVEPYDFTPLSGSPAINTGLDVGLPFIGPAKDIGAFESAVTEACGYVTGKVTVNSPTHDPIPGAMVGKSDDSVYVFTDATGAYRLPLPAGTYTLKATVAAFLPMTKTNVSVTAGSTRPNINFSLTPAEGRKWYVDVVNGNDSNDGKTLATAWQTIHKGDSTPGLLYPGDIVEVQAGTYTGANNWGAALILSTSGTVVAPIYYRANGRVIIDGSAFYTQNPVPWPIIGMHFGANYITVDGFEFTNVGYGCYLGGGPGAGRIGITIKNCIFHDIMPSRAGYPDGNHVGDPVGPDTGATMMASLACGIYDSWPNGINTFDHNLFYNIGVPGRVPDNPEGNDNWAFAIGGPRMMARIYNNTIVGTWKGLQGWVGVYSGTPSGDVKNNIIKDAWGGGLSMDDGTIFTGASNLFWNVASPLYGGATAPTGSVTASVGDMVADPKLDADYKLLANSAAIDSGVDTGLGYTFSGLAPDLGRYESSFTLATASKLSDLKSLADGSRVKLTEAKVATVNSATFSDGSYYIEEPNRFFGIKVVPNAANPAVLLGDRIGLIGVVGTDTNNERFIGLQSVTGQAAGDPLNTLGVANKSTVAAAGASVSGMLVRVWGKVTYKDPNGLYIYIDDGSGLNDGSGQTGIRVMLGGLVNAFSKVIPDSPLPYVSVTGVVGKIQDGSLYVPVIRLRGDDDLTIE
ncbi:MAG: carboxypeptidase regulatory-like domain-containing protein [Armatimonadota bacterium]